MKILSFDQSRCDLCGACGIACALVKKGRFEPEEARIRIETAGDLKPLRAVVCQHCEEPVCVTACMRGIIHKDKASGRVTRQFEDCFRCAACQVMCPVGAPVQDEDLKAFVTCDLCAGEAYMQGGSDSGQEPGVSSKEPLCVRVCPTGALRYEDAASVSEQRRNQYDRRALENPGVCFCGQGGAAGKPVSESAGAGKGTASGELPAIGKAQEKERWKEISLKLKESTGMKISPAQLKKWSDELKEMSGREGEMI